MNEQVSLFDTDNDKRYQFQGYYCNYDWSVRTATVNGVSDIVQSFKTNLTKDELKKMCDDAIEISRFRYGYCIKFLENNLKKELFVRFDNYTTSKKRNVYEHIDLYF